MIIRLNFWFYFAQWICGDLTLEDDEEVMSGVTFNSKKKVRSGALRSGDRSAQATTTTYASHSCVFLELHILVLYVYIHCGDYLRVMHH